LKHRERLSRVIIAKAHRRARHGDGQREGSRVREAEVHGLRCGTGALRRRGREGRSRVIVAEAHRRARNGTGQRQGSRMRDEAEVHGLRRGTGALWRRGREGRSRVIVAEAHRVRPHCDWGQDAVGRGGERCRGRSLRTEANRLIARRGRCTAHEVRGRRRLHEAEVHRLLLG
jgi:hypothetical protein